MTFRRKALQDLESRRVAPAPARPDWTRDLEKLMLRIQTQLSGIEHDISSLRERMVTVESQLLQLEERIAFPPD